MPRKRPPAPIKLPVDPVIEAYKAGVDVTLLRENLRLTPTQRLAKLEAWLASAKRLRGLAAHAHPRRNKPIDGE
jgi:hypothetical protein